MQNNEETKTVFHALLDAKESSKTYKVTFEHWPPIFINGVGGVVLTTANENRVTAILASALDNVCLENFSLLEDPPADEQGLRSIDLDLALWRAGILWNENILLDNLDLDKKLTLNEWKGFSKKNTFPEHITLLSALAVMDYSPIELQKITKIKMNEVICFVNAGYAVGLLSPTSNVNSQCASK